MPKINDQVEYAYNKGYKFGCQDELMMQYCNPKCIYYKRKDYLVSHKQWKPLEEDTLDYISVPTNPGDTIFFDSFIPHRSGPNMTDEKRRVLYVTYNAASEGDNRKKYYADKRLSYPPDIEREPNKKYVFRV